MTSKRVQLIITVIMFALTFASFEGLQINADNNQATKQVETTKPKLLNGWKGKKYYVDGKYVIGKYKIKKKWYVFGKNGKVRKKTTKVGKTTYYLNSKSKLEAYKTKKTYYFPSGKKMKSYQKNDYITLRRARKIVKKITNKKMSKEQKRWKCFMWVSHHPYLTFRHFKPKNGWTSTYANDHFIRKGGDCHADGAAFAYLAKALGYKKCYAVLDSNGYTKQGHCWAEVNGKVFDPLFIERGRKVKDYNSTYQMYGLHPVRKFRVARYY